MTNEGEVDEAWFARVRMGDRGALAEVFQHYRPRLKQAVEMRMDRRLYGRIDPSDVVQETFLDADRRLAEFQADPQRLPLFLWLRLLVAQRLVDLYRKHVGAAMRDASVEISLDQQGVHASSVWLAAHLVDERDSGSRVAMRAELQEQLYAALETMDEIDRDVLAMRHFEQLTNQEVALALGISETASSNRYIRALRRLKEILVPDDHEI